MRSSGVEKTCRAVLPAILAVSLAAAEGRAEEPESPARPPAGAAKAGLGAMNPLRTSRFDVALGSTLPGQRDLGGAPVRLVGLHFALVPRWSFVDTKDDWAWVGAKLGLLAEWGPDNTFAPLPDDVELHGAYSRTLVR